MMFRQSVHMIVTVGALCAGGLPADARNMTAAERAGMFAMFADISDSFRLGDHYRPLDHLPSRWLPTIAPKEGIDIGTLKAAVNQKLAWLIGSLTQVSEQYEFSTMREEEQSLGEPYAIILHTVILDITSDERLKIQQTQTALMQDGGAWQLIYLGAPPLRDILIAAYPTFKDIKVSAITTRTILP